MALKPNLRSVPLNPRGGAPAASTLTAAGALSDFSTVAGDYVDAADRITNFNNQTIFTAKANDYSNQLKLEHPIDPEAYRDGMHAWANEFIKSNPNFLKEGSESAAKINESFLAIGTSGANQLLINQRNFQNKEIRIAGKQAEQSLIEELYSLVPTIAPSKDGNNSTSPEMEVVLSSLRDPLNKEVLSLVARFRQNREDVAGALNGAVGTETKSEINLSVKAFKEVAITERLIDIASQMPRTQGLRFLNKSMWGLSEPTANKTSNAMAKLKSEMGDLWDQKTSDLLNRINEITFGSEWSGLSNKERDEIQKKIGESYSPIEAVKFFSNIRASLGNEQAVQLSTLTLTGDLTLEAINASSNLSREQKLHFLGQLSKKSESALANKLLELNGYNSLASLNSAEKSLREELQNTFVPTTNEQALIDKAFLKRRQSLVLDDYNRKAVRYKNELKNSYNKMSSDRTLSVIARLSKTGELPVGWNLIPESVIPTDYTPPSPEMSSRSGENIPVLASDKFDYGFQNFREISDADKKRVFAALQKTRDGRADLEAYVLGNFPVMTPKAKTYYNASSGRALVDVFFLPDSSGREEYEALQNDITDSTLVTPAATAHRDKVDAANNIANTFNGILPSLLVDSMKAVPTNGSIDQFRAAQQMMLIFSATGNAGDLLSAVADDQKALEFWSHVTKGGVTDTDIKNILEHYSDPDWKSIGGRTDIADLSTLDEETGTTPLQIILKKELLAQNKDGTLPRFFKSLWNMSIPKNADDFLGLSARVVNRTNLGIGVGSLTGVSLELSSPEQVLGLVDSIADNTRIDRGASYWSVLWGATNKEDLFTTRLGPMAEKELMQRIATARMADKTSTIETLARQEIYKFGVDAGYDPSSAGDGAIQRTPEGAFGYPAAISLRPPTVTYNYTIDQSRRALINEANRNYAIMREEEGDNFGNPTQVFDAKTGLSTALYRIGAARIAGVFDSEGVKDPTTGRLDFTALYDMGRLWWGPEDPPGSKQYSITIIDDAGEAFPITREADGGNTMVVSNFKILNPDNPAFTVSTTQEAN